ncbi:DUF1761 domain-containing protein [Rathayibacter sp. SD072]|uniref:DUF1761 domain-containing protein n=1 Tax=Rathayibacter sp. SD072 TaxID=2781731 RepID=UPI001A976866|nr:DUF1761 domain-containing protein [Rathayibacter sp. SD072]MBO0982661.1 DUF1761 domain-containing protein [Rathayibacter sp. SD072]
MFNVLPEINWLAVIVSTLVFAVLGYVYFVILVPKPYKIALGNENRELPAPGLLLTAGPLIPSLAIVITTAVLLRALAVETFGDALAFGLIIGVGYLVAQTLTIALNPNFPRPLLYTLLNAPYFVICTVAASIILTLWR